MLALKKALSEAEDKAATERTEREKQDARVREVQQELQEFGKKFESLEHDFKTKESELVKALLSAKDAKAEAQKAQQEIQAAKKIAAGKAFFMQSKHVEETFLSDFGFRQTLEVRTLGCARRSFPYQLTSRSLARI